jgi:hypothetical protein
MNASEWFKTAVLNLGFAKSVQVVRSLNLLACLKVFQMAGTSNWKIVSKVKG